MATEKTVSVTAEVTVKQTLGSWLTQDLGVYGGFDFITDLLGKSLLLELVSADLDPNTGKEKESIKSYARKAGGEEEVKYKAKFEVPSDFGPIGAVFVENEHKREMFVKDIMIESYRGEAINFSCNSWVESKAKTEFHKRVFFITKSYLPSQTPSGLVRIRGEELIVLRGNGEGERKAYERIYDYDVYNDLGNPDKSEALNRPILGGKKHPYPRRCRTGRPHCKKNPLCEERSLIVYVPRDEQFSAVKGITFSVNAVYQILHALVPSLEAAMINSKLGFEYFTSIDSLYDEGVALPKKHKFSLTAVLPRLVNTINKDGLDVVRFERPSAMDRDKFFWFRDEEFARQTLAGLNPYCLKLITEWPLKSSLDPEIYGPPESTITAKMIEEEIGGYMSFEEALREKKLFILDYHDLLLPFVKKVRALEGATLYGSRTVFFLTPDETLKPLAIELTRPPFDENPVWNQVYRPSTYATGVWLWRMAKAQVLSHDAGIHQLASHWLRTHSCTEPYIIATNRQLSEMHPINRLLKPHFRYTMEINALARALLICADGIIEGTFSPGKYCMEISSVAYDLLWQFNTESLPGDLINRGIAVEDPNEPHGLKLVIKDYPFANDGLLLWDTLKDWISDYVNHYYVDDIAVQSDEELQAWWTEIRTVGHGDKKDEPWWPEPNSRTELIGIVTTIAWVASGHHAAVNFGQYAYGGYFPNRPTISRINMPDEEPDEQFWNNFMKKPEGALLQCFPSQIQATKVMAVLDTLSGHSPDEEYLGKQIEPAWADEVLIKAAYERFCGRLNEMEATIDERNANSDLKNRNGAGILPYELLKPYSEPGVTGKGVPYSISI